MKSTIFTNYAERNGLTVEHTDIGTVAVMKQGKTLYFAQDEDANNLVCESELVADKLGCDADDWLCWYLDSAGALN